MRIWRVNFRRIGFGLFYIVMDIELIWVVFYYYFVDDDDVEKVFNLVVGVEGGWLCFYLSCVFCSVRFKYYFWSFSLVYFLKLISVGLVGCWYREYLCWVFFSLMGVGCKWWI